MWDYDGSFLILRSRYLFQLTRLAGSAKTPIFIPKNVQYAVKKLENG